ncbi:MAG: multiprotein bridging factor aMBF1 [Candidatus Bathyarchaeia archaeon]
MRCEVCGRKILGPTTRALIEGAKLTVCIECSKHGKIIHEEEVEAKQRVRNKPLTHVTFVQRKPVKAKVDTTREIVEGYDSKIRQAREKLGLSHEELGKKINEKASVLSKLETGKMTPNNQLVTKLEHVLKIKLLVPIQEEKLQGFPKSLNRETTLGDLIKLNKKGEEEPTERKQS